MARRLLRHGLPLALLTACSTADPPVAEIASSYVQLALALDRRDPGFAGAYYGPPEWQRDALDARRPLPEMRDEARRLLDELSALEGEGSEERLRLRHLRARLDSLLQRVLLLSGAEWSFDEESRRLYGVQAPNVDEKELLPVLERLDDLLPGSGSPLDRFRALSGSLVVPPPNVDDVLRAALEFCRRKTTRHLDLPEGERVEIEYVTRQPWAAYARYEGNSRTRIRINLGFALTVDDLVHLACHEGYPGHHAHYSLIDKQLYRERGWVEYSVIPFYGPHSIVAEGAAEVGVELVLRGDEGRRFERDVLLPLAGLESREVREAHELLQVVRPWIRKLEPGLVEGTRRHLDGRLDRPSAAAWLERHALAPDPEATLGFANRYRTHVITYTCGRNLVRRHLDARAGSTEWAAFGELVLSPHLPSDLATDAC